MDQLLRQDTANSSRIWITFCARQQPELDGRLVAWAKQLGLARLPISIFEDEHGPPAYRIPEDSVLVVVYARQRRIVARQTYSRQDWPKVRPESLAQEIRRFFESNR